MLFYGTNGWADGQGQALPQSGAAWGAQQPQEQYGAWGASGPAYTPAPAPDPWTGPPVLGAAPGWEAMYAGGQVSAPTPSPVAPPAAPIPQYGSFGGANMTGSAPIQAPAPAPFYGADATAQAQQALMSNLGGSWGGSAVPAAPAPQMMTTGGSANFNPSTGGYDTSPAAQPGLPAANPYTSGINATNPYLSDQLGYLKDFMGDVRDKNLQSIRGQYSGGNGVNNIGLQLQQNDYLRDFDRNLGGLATNMLANNWGTNLSNQTANRGLDIQGFNAGVNAQDTAQRGQLNTLSTLYGLGSQSMRDQWYPLQTAASIYAPFSNLNSAAGNGGSGSNWQSALGGIIGGAQFARNMGWW